jgi:hypothetical protein
MFTLRIARTAGVSGTPSQDSLRVAAGTSVAYSFQAVKGFSSISVLLDGTSAAPAGSVLIYKDRYIAAGATQIAVGTARDSAVSRTLGQLDGAVDPPSVALAIARSLDSLATAIGISAAAGAASSALAIEAQKGVALSERFRVDSALADLDLPIAIGGASSGQVARSAPIGAVSSASDVATVPLEVIYLNGIRTSPTDFLTSMVRVRAVISDASIPADATNTVQAFGHYIKTSGTAQTDPSADCGPLHLIDALASLADYVKVANAAGGCYGDFGLAAKDIANTLTSGNPTADAIGTIVRLRAALHARHAVLVLAHSRGTLIAQEAIKQLLQAEDPTLHASGCVGFVSVASPYYIDGLLQSAVQKGTIVQGVFVADLMYALGGPKANGIQNELATGFDQKFASLTAYADPVAGWYNLWADYHLHSIDQSYLGSPATYTFIQHALRDAAGGLRQSCAFRTPALITLSSADNPSGAPNATLASPAVFTVLDAAGQPIAGVNVHFSVQSGDIVAPTDQVTAADGTVTVPVKLGSIGGPAVLAASVVGAAVPPALLHVTVSPQPASPSIALSASSAPFSGTQGGPDPQPQMINVSNAGGGVLSGLSATVNYQSGQPNGWLSASLSKTTAPATLTLVPTLGSLSAGTHEATVSISSTAGGIANSPQTVSVSLTLRTGASAPTIALSSASISFVASAGGSSPVPQNVSITNSGTGTLSGLSASLTYQGGQASGWLAAALSSTASPTTLTLTPTTSALSAGTYNATVSLTSSAAGVTNSPKGLPVTLTVNPGVSTGALTVSIAGLPGPPYYSSGNWIDGPNAYNSGFFNLDANTSSRNFASMVPGSYTVHWGAQGCSAQGGCPDDYGASPSTSSVSVPASTQPVSVTGQYMVTSGALQVTVTGLPTGCVISIGIDGPQGRLGTSTAVTAGTPLVLRHLQAGSYSIDWGANQSCDGTQGSFHPTQQTTTFIVPASTSPAAVSMSYQH